MSGYENYVDKLPDNESISTLSGLIEDLRDADLELQEAEAVLKKAQDRKREIEEKQIPELMIALKMEEFKTTSGVKVGLEQVLSVTPRKENRQRVLNWLEKRGSGALIKRTLSVAFNKDQDEEVASLVKFLVEERRMPTKEERKVESQTLKKYVKELLEAGEDVPTDLLGIFQYNRAKIVEGKPKLVFKDEE